MNRSENKLFAHMSPEAVVFQGGLQGDGAAIPVIPTTVISTTSALHYMAASNNYFSGTAGDITRSGVGVYTAKLKDSVPVILDILAKVWGADGKQVQITDYNPTTRIVSFKTFTAAGVAVDVASTDDVKFTFVGQLSAPTY